MLADFQELWLTSKRGALPKSNEVQTINVAKYCEKLRLAITQPRNGLQRPLEITLKNQANDLTFRSVSCLCFTTLRVHELQVNDLLKINIGVPEYPLRSILYMIEWATSDFFNARCHYLGVICLCDYINSSEVLKILATNVLDCALDVKPSTNKAKGFLSLTSNDRAGIVLGNTTKLQNRKPNLKLHSFLIDRSEMLVAQSGSWSGLKLSVKRKSSQSFAHNCSQTKRKRKQSVRHSIESTISITDYTQLLDETQNIVEWSKSTEVVNKTVSNLKKTKVNGSRTTCINIREITIKEVDTHHAERYATDEDEGFGNATADELKTLTRMMEDPSVSKPKATKRKMMETRSICEKRPKLNNVSANDNSQTEFEDTEIEIARSAETVNNCATDQFSPPMEINDDITTELPDAVATRNTSDIDENDGNSFEDMDSRSNDVDNNNIEERSAYENESCIDNNKQQESWSITTGKSLKQSDFKTKVIIDERTHLTKAEMITQQQVQVNLRKKLSKMRAKVKWNSKAQHSTLSRKYYERISPTARELLSTLNRSCIAMRKFKLKSQKAQTSLKAFVISSTERSLLCEILNREITDDLVNEVFENSNRVGRTRRRRLPPASVQDNLPSLPQLEDDYNQLSLVANTEMPSESINNNIANIECVVEESSTTNEQDEFGAFDIMTKLLNLWRSKKVLGEEINVEHIFKSTKMLRKQAAKAFYALLKLAANEFIVLQTAQKSTHLQGIKLGPASAKLIQKSDLKGMTLKRRHNGFRIHAN